MTGKKTENAEPKKVDQATKRKKRPNAINLIWRLLWPKKFGAAGEAGEGSTQIMAMFGLCVARVWIMNKMSALVGLLDRNMMTRNQSEFWKLWRYSFVMAMIASVHRQTYKFFESSLGLVWQKKLTKILHEKYFTSTNYYAIAQGGAQNGRVSIRDPDERIVTDVKDVANQMSLVFCEGLYTSTAGGFFAYKLGRLYGIRYALAPYLYLWASFAFTQKAFPVNWGKLRSKIRALFSRYRESHQRVETHHEAIRALQGEKYEEEELNNKLDELIKSTKNFDVDTMASTFGDQLFFHWWLRTFVSWFVIGPHVLSPRKGRDLKSLEGIAELRGSIGHQFVLFVQSMIAAGVSAKMLRQLQKLAGTATRIHELSRELDRLKSERSSKDEKSIVEGDYIEFEHVKVVTPTGNTLVEDLNFRLDRGSSMLLTGHNGAGKSSIFRCLGGLWKTPTGKIHKPGSSESGLHQDVFYLPQKPYNVLGTLRDQLTYPRCSGDAEIGVEEIRDILSMVNLSYLIDRPGALDSEINWDSELSLGEKQRLSIARLVFHKPKFAILDECTSSVSREMEKGLYAICSDLNITYITISHRPVLRQYHDKLLTIGIGNAGYLFEDLPPRVRLNFSDLSLELSEEGSKSIQMKANSSTKEKTKNEKSTLQRVLRLFELGMPEDYALRIGLYVVGTIAQSRLLIDSTLLTSGMMACVFSTEPRNERAKKFLSLCSWAGIYGLAIAVLERGVEHLQSELKLDFHKKLSKNLQKRYMENGRFYNIIELKSDHMIQDPSQRIVSDVKDLSEKLMDLLPLVKPLIEISWFARRIHQLVGFKATFSFMAYLGLGVTLIRKIMPNFKAIVSKERELEGRYKFAHARVQTHAESIAFFGGDNREKDIADGYFKQLVKINLKKLQTDWQFGLFNQAIVREAPMLVQWILRNEYSRQNATDESVKADSGQKLNYNQLFLFNATNYTFEAIGTLLSSGEQIANLAGLVSRVSELDEALDKCPCIKSNIGEAGEAIIIENLDITTPNGQSLAKSINVSVTPDKPLMVTGPNASGKTALFRLIGGLWPASSTSRVKLPLKDGKPDVFLVPQKVYMVPGSLADQITYPVRVTELTEEVKENLLELLKLVGVPYLVDRENGWNATMKWEDVLSLGEQQRIGMARLFFNKPKFGVLDECTSAVSVDVEKNLYQRAADLGISCITISQRLALHEFHAQELKLGESTESKWSVNVIADSLQESVTKIQQSGNTVDEIEPLAEDEHTLTSCEAELVYYKWLGGKTEPGTVEL